MQFFYDRLNQAPITDAMSRDPTFEKVSPHIVGWVAMVIDKCILVPGGNMLVYMSMFFFCNAWSTVRLSIMSCWFWALNKCQSL